MASVHGVIYHTVYGYRNYRVLDPCIRRSGGTNIAEKNKTNIKNPEIKTNSTNREMNVHNDQTHKKI